MTEFGAMQEWAAAHSFSAEVRRRGARFALTEVTLGIMPGAGGTQMLPRVVGERRAKEIILTGQAFTAQQALEWGVVNRVCPSGELVTEALALAGRIAANAPLAVQAIKRAVDRGQGLPLDEGMKL